MFLACREVAATSSKAGHLLEASSGRRPAKLANAYWSAAPIGVACCVAHANADAVAARLCGTRHEQRVVVRRLEAYGRNCPDDAREPARATVEAGFDLEDPGASVPHVEIHAAPAAARECGRGDAEPRRSPVALAGVAESRAVRVPLVLVRDGRAVVDRVEDPVAIAVLSG